MTSFANLLYSKSPITSHISMAKKLNNGHYGFISAEKFLVNFYFIVF